jgi:hypothetical protein
MFIGERATIPTTEPAAMTTTSKTEKLIAGLRISTAHFIGRTPDERSRTAAIARERGRCARGETKRVRVNAAGVPYGLPIRRRAGETLPIFSTLPQEVRERLKRVTLGGVLVFDRSEF